MENYVSRHVRNKKSLFELDNVYETVGVHFHTAARFTCLHMFCASILYVRTYVQCSCYYRLLCTRVRSIAQSLGLQSGNICSKWTQYMDQSILLSQSLIVFVQIRCMDWLERKHASFQVKNISFRTEPLFVGLCKLENEILKEAKNA